MVNSISSQLASIQAISAQAQPVSKPATPVASSIQIGKTAVPSQVAKENPLQKASEALKNLARAEASQPPATPAGLSHTNHQTAHRAYTLKTGGS